MTDRQLCIATTLKGDPCPNSCLPDSEYCFAHDPALEEIRSEGRRKGGRKRKHPTAGDYDPVDNLTDLVDRLNADIALCNELDQTVDVLRLRASLYSMLAKVLADRDQIEASRFDGVIEIRYVNDWRNVGKGGGGLTARDLSSTGPEDPDADSKAPGSLRSDVAPSTGSPDPIDVQLEDPDRGWWEAD